MPATTESVENPVASWRIAIIDDAYAAPGLSAVNEGLEQFCAEVSGDESVTQLLSQRTQCDFGDAARVTNEAIVALYGCRADLQSITRHLDELFLGFDQRRDELARIERNLRAFGCREENIKTFDSIQDLFAGEPFQLVFLDLLLANGEEESQRIAKDIYEKFKAFILLMSNSPIVNPQLVEGFRRASRLLSGFFVFRAKEDLCNEDRFRIQMETLPKDPEVCHAVHNFVIALEKALGSPIEEPPVSDADSEPGNLASILPQFMHTLRTLGLHDYALLCELTLRGEGHPLGDYMMRLLGSHLLSRLLGHPDVKNAVIALDKLRFTEFLPFGDDRSPSFHRMFADATTEAITGPWEPHPWSVTTDAPALETAAESAAGEEPAQDQENTSPSEVAPAPEPADMQAVSEILDLLGIEDDGCELPYVQLGDLLIKDEQSLVYAVLSASCELQFVPTHVHRDRERLRDDTVLLVPGRLRTIGTPPSKGAQTTAGIIEWNGRSYCIEWFDGKLVGIPHCGLVTLLKDRGYLHCRRLQTARALELQQAVLSKLSRIGLEVRPPFPRDIRITLYGRQPDQSFVALGGALTQGGLLFHGRKQEQRVLILRQAAFYDFVARMKSHAETVAAIATVDGRFKTALAQGANAFTTAMGGLKLPIEIPATADPKAVQLVDSAGGKKAIRQVAIRFGGPSEAPATSNRELMFCLSAEEE